MSLRLFSNDEAVSVSIPPRRSAWRRTLSAPGLFFRTLFQMKGRVALAMLSGLALACGLPSINFWPLGFVALIPFLLSLRAIPGARAALLGLVFGWTYSYASLFWLNSIYYFAPPLLGSSELMAGVAVVLLAFYCGAYYALFAWLGEKFRRRNPALAAVSLPALWVVLEWVRSLGQLAFPWAYIAHTQSSNLAFIQMADIAGTWLISYILVSINVLLFQLFFERSATRRTLWIRIGAITALIAFPYAYGIFRLHQDWSRGEALHVAVSQTNVDQPHRYYSYAFADEPQGREFSQQIQAIQFEDILQIHRLAPQTQLYVLPETAFTQADFQDDKELQDEIAGLAREVKGSIFFGADNAEVDSKTGQKRIYVSAWMADPLKGMLPKPYDKMRLVPFGESLPYFEYIPYFRDKVLGMVTAARGREYRTFVVDGMRFGCGICFESASPMQLVQMVRHGAQFLTVITNDSWYYHPKWHLDGRGAPQHDALSTFRAIENRRWIVRAACTGISRLIDPAGRTIKQAPREERAFLTGDVHAQDIRTPYTRFGDWFIVVAAGLMIVSVRSRKMPS